MAKVDCRGERALVTGASGGMGADFARELARRGADLVLVARRRELLDGLAEELREAHKVAVEVIAMDLAERDAPRRLVDELAERALTVDFLVNNAGLGVFGRFLDVPWERHEGLIDLDIKSLTHLTRLLVPPMVERGRGRVLQVASIGAFQASPLYSSYAAAKAYVLHFSEALSYELAGTGVTCTALCPGVTATGFFDAAGQEGHLTQYQRAFMMRSADVARVGVEAALAGRRVVIPGFANAANTWFERFLPRRLNTHLAYLLLR